MILSLIAAMSENRVIGVDQDLPWYLPQDLRRFKRIIRGHPQIMGRKTFETITRLSHLSRYVVITRDKNWKPKTKLRNKVTVVHTLKDALDTFRNYKGEVFVLGGGEIYRQTIHLADRVYLTIIHKKFKGDTYFPKFNKNRFRINYQKDYLTPVSFSFIDYFRK